MHPSFIFPLAPNACQHYKVGERPECTETVPVMPQCDHICDSDGMSVTGGRTSSGECLNHLVLELLMLLVLLHTNQYHQHCGKKEWANYRDYSFWHLYMRSLIYKYPVQFIIWDCLVQSIKTVKCNIATTFSDIVLSKVTGWSLDTICIDLLSSRFG